MRKKGQAAMEFLMTYGWAILAAIVVIGVLAVYFRPGTLTQNSVVVTAPLYGVGVVYSGAGVNEVQVEVKNNGGETITTTAASITFTSPSTATSPCAATGGVGALSAGATQVIVFGDCALDSGDNIQADVAISYTRAGSSLTLSSTGSLSGSVA